MMFGTKLIDVEFYLKKIKHNLESSKFINFEENKNYFKKIYDFVDYYIGKRGKEIHSLKLTSLEKIRRYAQHIIILCTEEDKEGVLKNFNLLYQEFINKYSLCGSIYLLRHAERLRGTGRDLSLWGVKQAKHVAELIQEEILLSPKPVRVFIHTSEAKRTNIFGQIVNHINKAENIGKKVIVSQQENRFLYMGNLSERASNLVEEYRTKYGANKGTVLAFKTWLAHQPPFEEEIRNKGITDPNNALNNIIHFVRFAQQDVRDLFYYPIIIGISHSWILDTFLYKLTAIEEIISTAEYAKIEFNNLYYKGRWYNL